MTIEDTNTFEKNIVRIYQNKGKLWLDALPKKIQQLKKIWELDHLQPFDNLSYNYVLSGYQKQTPIVLKLTLDESALSYEIKALKAFAEYGAVSILGYSNEALLLKRATPGLLLQSCFPKGTHNAIKIACDVMKRLHQAPIPKNNDFPHIKDWLNALDQNWNIPQIHLHKARILKKELLKTDVAPVLLHGDLHQSNILSNGNDWLIIDPKGVIGYPINEIWACIEDPEYDLAFISNYLNLDFENVMKWYYVHLVLAACWKVEDGLNPKQFLALADLFNTKFMT